jgi:AcrR family transcriptional regulator
MARKRSVKGGNSKAAILSSAREVFGRSGYHGASVERIARRAGVAKGTVFLHFKSKENLLIALVEDYFATVEEIYTQITPAELGPREQLEMIGAVEHWDQAGVSDFGQVLMGTWGGLPAKVRKRVEALMHKTFTLYLKRVAGLFRQMLGRDSIDGVSVEALAGAYLAGLDGLMVRERMLPGAKPSAKLVAEAFRKVLIDRLCPDGGDSREGR